MNPNLSRRELLIAGAGAAALSLAGDAPKAQFRLSLNTGTIRGQKLSLVQEIDVIAKAGYDAFEPWIGELDTYVKGGGSLKDLRARLSDKNLRAEDAIGFFEWGVDDETKRAKSIEDVKRNMDMLAQIGCTHLAAPPCGMTAAPMPVEKLAPRYRALLEAGDKVGVTPALELWGFSKTMSKIEEVVQIAKAAAHPKACVLLDVFHLYKGQNDFSAIRNIDAALLPIFHMNDYPADPPREKIGDAQRVYPGDGIAPFPQLIKDLRAIGFNGILSLEIFNRAEWQKDAAEVARTGVEKLRKITS